MMFVRGKVEERFSTFFICANFSSMIYHFFFHKKVEKFGSLKNNRYLCINKQGKIMETTKTITVRFKEAYMNHPVERTCMNMTREQVIDIYNLDDPDIEWYEFIRG